MSQAETFAYRLYVVSLWAWTLLRLWHRRDLGRRSRPAELRRIRREVLRAIRSLDPELLPVTRGALRREARP